jgi:hypothetical protein
MQDQLSQWHLKLLRQICMVAFDTSSGIIGCLKGCCEVYKAATRCSVLCQQEL